MSEKEETLKQETVSFYLFSLAVITHLYQRVQKFIWYLYTCPLVHAMCLVLKGTKREQNNISFGLIHSLKISTIQSKISFLSNLEFQGFKVSRFLFAMITYNVPDLLKKIQKIVKKARKPIKKL